MSRKSKKFSSVPLPFLGQKRRFLNQVKEVVKDCSNDTIYFDLFGGSGLLSHTIKAEKPNANVVYNDYDNYSFRIENVDYTNVLLNDIRELKGLPERQKDCRTNKTGYFTTY